VRCLDTNFREALNLRLSLQGHLRVDTLGRSHVEDSYALDQVIQKAVDLVSGKTIARAFVRGPLIRDSRAHSSPPERSCSRSNITM